MAQLKRRQFGEIIGGLGDMVYRSVQGTSVVSRRPIMYTKPTTAAYNFKISRFRTAVLFGIAAAKLKDLKEIWRRLYPIKRPYNLIISCNHSAAQPGDIKEYAVISPPAGFGVRLNTTEFDGSLLKVDLHPLTNDSGIDVSKEKSVKLEMVGVFSDPLISDVKPVYMFPIISEAAEFNLTDPLSFRFLMSTANVDMAKRYGRKKIFCSLVTLGEDARPLRASATFCAVL